MLDATNTAPRALSKFRITHNGEHGGTYQASCKVSALDAYARDLGLENSARLIPAVKAGEIRVSEVSL